MTTTQGPGLRPAGPGDTELLFRIYASTRAAELAEVPWDASVKEAFLRMQFGAQDAHYRAAFPRADHDLIVSGDEVIGRLYVDRGPDAWLVIDIALLPAYRGRGIGTALLGALLTEAAATAKPVRLHVERLNPAQRLYGRLGFRPLADDEGVYMLLERGPAPYPNTTS